MKRFFDFTPNKNECSIMDIYADYYGKTEHQRKKISVQTK